LLIVNEGRKMAKGDDIQERMIEFAVRIIKLCSTLPKSPVGKHIANQLLRSGTSPAPNYGEARGAESAGDFVHKLGIVFKDLNETNIWLEIILRSGLIAAERIQEIRNECVELSKIISSSIKTVGKKNRPR